MLSICASSKYYWLNPNVMGNKFAVLTTHSFPFECFNTAGWCKRLKYTNSNLGGASQEVCSTVGLNVIAGIHKPANKLLYRD